MEQTGKELCQQTEHPQSGLYRSGLRHRSCQERPPAQVVSGTAHERFDFANTRAGDTGEHIRRPSSK